MSLYRIPIVWTGAQIQGGGLTTFYFSDAGGTAAQAVTAVNTFLAATEDRRVIGTAWAFAGDVQILNTATGALQAVTTVTPSSGTGTLAGDALPAQTQGLLRLLTTSVVSGRLLRGRLFLPGCGEADSGSGGTPGSTYRNDYDAAAAALIADGSSVWQVWSHTHGSAGDVTQAITWTKYAALRSRRD